MKTNCLVAVLFSVIMFSTSCDNKVTTGQLDPNAMINIRPGSPIFAQNNAGLRSINSSHLSALEIVKQTTNLKYTFQGNPWGRGFSDPQRDTIAPMLKMWGTDIISMDGELVPDFIESSNCILQRIINGDKPNMVIDTIAYIPNAVLRAAETRIKEAFAKEDYTTCYHVFDSAFVFIPINGAEWEVLKAAGNQ